MGLAESREAIAKFLQFVERLPDDSRWGSMQAIADSAIIGPPV
jgi:hypothetical protein